MRGPAATNSDVELFVLLLDFPQRVKASSLSSVLLDVHDHFGDVGLDGFFANLIRGNLFDGVGDGCQFVESREMSQNGNGGIDFIIVLPSNFSLKI